ncbi:hypothetical protein OH77DRAFT_63148 [Trametes cingulata]|nr:hypothetical protein OH77DRAFT_63148 [Trametes cingulata]
MSITPRPRLSDSVQVPLPRTATALQLRTGDFAIAKSWSILSFASDGGSQPLTVVSGRSAISRIPSHAAHTRHPGSCCATCSRKRGVSRSARQCADLSSGSELRMRHQLHALKASHGGMHPRSSVSPTPRVVRTFIERLPTRPAVLPETRTQPPTLRLTDLEMTYAGSPSLARSPPPANCRVTPVPPGRPNLFHALTRFLGQYHSLILPGSLRAHAILDSRGAHPDRCGIPLSNIGHVRHVASSSQAPRGLW